MILVLKFSWQHLFSYVENKKYVIWFDFSIFVVFCFY